MENWREREGYLFWAGKVEGLANTFLASQRRERMKRDGRLRLGLFLLI